MESYASSSARFREHLQQVATDKPSPNKPAEGLSLVERVRAKDADILHNLVKHVTGGPLILDLPSRSTSGDGADGSDMSDIDSGSSSSDGSTEDEIYTDDEDFDPNKKEEGEEEHRFRRSLVGQGAVVVDQKTMLAHHFFGQRSTDVIMKINGVEPIQKISGLSLRLWDYQKHGVAKIIECWQGRYGSCILADEMGLGKTIQAIVASMLDRDDTPAAFSLIITTKTCVKQWAQQMEMHFEEAYRPSFKILDSGKVTAQELIESDFDFVICSYGFIQSQHRRLRAYQTFFNDVESKGQREAEATTKVRSQKRPKLSLFSELYSIKNMPIRHLILDEAQYVKNWDTATHQAIKALDYLKFLAVTGTPIANRWWDIYGIIDFMKAHPFHTYADFIRVCGDSYSRRADPPPSKLPRLVKFLMEVTISRPATLLELPGLERTACPFLLNELEFDCVLLYTQMFLEALRKQNHSARDAHFRTATSARKAIIFSTRAQQYAAHPALMQQDISQDLAGKMGRMRVMRARAKLQFPNQATLRGETLALISYLRGDLWDKKEPGELGESGEPKENPDDPEDLEDPDYDPNKGLDVDDEGPGIGGANDQAEEEDDDEDEQENNAGKRKQWLGNVKKMDDNSLKSSRIDAIHDIYSSIKSKDDNARIVIFSKFVTFLDIVAEVLKRRAKIVPLRLDGLSNKEQRLSTTNEFASTLGSTILITPRTGGAGLNGLECASSLIQCEPWWTGTEEKQAYGRLFRPLQDKVVKVYYLEAGNSTIDVLIEKIRDGKSDSNEKIMGPLRRTDDEPPKIPKVLERY